MGGFERLSGRNELKKVDISTICVPETMAVSTVTEVRTLPVILGTAELPQQWADEFDNSDYYIEESLPSSLEWGRDERQVHHLENTTSIDDHCSKISDTVS